MFEDSSASIGRFSGFWRIYAVRRRLFLLAVLCIIANPAFAGDPEPKPEAYPPAADKPHPQVVLPKLDRDGALALKNWRGKKVLLIHFASWSSSCRKELPKWYEKTQPLVADKKLVVIGIAQDQYADRARLFLQWKQIDWPVMFDPVDLVGVQNLPVVVAIDEYGYVRDPAARLDTFEDKFVAKTFAKPDTPAYYNTEELPEPKVTRRVAGQGNDATAWRNHGDAIVFSGREPLLDEAVTVYTKVTHMTPGDAGAFFRLGVAYRLRADSSRKKDGDEAAALAAWAKAAKLSPNQNIFRGRAQQFHADAKKAATLHKWIATARKEITARKEKPIVLKPDPLKEQPAEEDDKGDKP
jgi:peroxiredoxin